MAHGPHAMGPKHPKTHQPQSLPPTNTILCYNGPVSLRDTKYRATFVFVQCIHFVSEFKSELV